MSVVITGLGSSGKIVYRVAGNKKDKGAVPANGREVTDGGPGDRDGKKNGQIKLALPKNRTVFVQIDKGQPGKWGDDDEFRRVMTKPNGGLKQVRPMTPLVVSREGHNLRQGERIVLLDRNGKVVFRSTDNGGRDWDRNTDNPKFTTLVSPDFDGRILVGNRLYAVNNGRVGTTDLRTTPAAPSKATLLRWLSKNRNAFRALAKGDMRAVAGLQAALIKVKGTNDIVLTGKDLKGLFGNDALGRQLEGIASQGMEMRTFMEQVTNKGVLARGTLFTEFKTIAAKIFAYTNGLLLTGPNGTTSQEVLRVAAEKAGAHLKNFERLEKLLADLQRKGQFLMSTGSVYDTTDYKAKIQTELTGISNQFAEFIADAGQKMKSLVSTFGVLKTAEERAAADRRMSLVFSALASVGSLGFAFSNASATLGATKSFWSRGSFQVGPGNWFSLPAVAGSGTLFGNNAWNTAMFNKQIKAYDDAKNYAVSVAESLGRKDLAENAKKVNGGIRDFLDGIRAVQIMLFKNSDAYDRSEGSEVRSPKGAVDGEEANVTLPEGAVYAYWKRNDEEFENVRWTTWIPIYVYPKN